MPYFRPSHRLSAYRVLDGLSLKAKTTLFALGLFFGAIWLSAWLSTGDLRNSLEQRLASQQFVTVTYVANGIDEAVRTRLESLSMIASGLDPRRLADPPALQSYLEQRRAIYRLFDNGLIAIRRDGVAVAEYPHLPGRNGASFQGQDFFRKVVETGQPAVGKPRIGRFTDKPVIPMAVPILGASGEVVGVLAGINVITGGDVFSVVAPSTLGGVGDVHVISPRDGVFVTSTDSARILAPVPAPGLNLAHDRWMAGEEGSAVAVSSRGVEELSSARYVRSVGWFVVGVLPTATAFRSIDEMQLRIYAQAGLLSVVVGGLIWLFVFREVAPLGRCAATLRDMSVGTARPDILPVEGCSELRQLLTAFNRLTARLWAQEDVLRQSQERYRSLVELQSDVIVRFGEDGALTFANEAARKRLGEPFGSPIGRQWSEFVLEEDIAVAALALDRTARGDDSHCIVELRLRTATGGARWYLAEGAVVRTADGGIGEFQVTCRDISDRKQAEEVRLGRLNLLRALIEAIPAAVFYKDENGVYLGCNTRFEDFVGAPSDRIVGGTAASIADAATARLYGQADQRVLETRRPYTYNFTVVEPDGRVRHMRTHKAPFDKADGSVGGVVGIVLDITADVDHENELKAAREAADEVNRAKSRFLAAMSHELRTPLNAILGFAEILRDPAYVTDAGGNQDEYLGYIHSSGRHLLDLINDILDISKIESGGMQIDPTRVPPASAVDGALRLLRDRAERGGLEVACRIPRDIPDLWVDPRAVRQILANLLSNAIKFTPRGGKVAIAAHADGDRVALVVSDTGPGIPADELERVLKPFEQLDNRYARARGGTGLGLSLVQGLVGLHGGSLEIETEVGRGSTFTVRLPTAQSGPSVDLARSTP